MSWTSSEVSWADRGQWPVRLPGWVSGRVSPNSVRLPSPSWMGRSSEPYRLRLLGETLLFDTP